VGSNANGELKGSIRTLPKDEGGRSKGFGFIRGENGKDYFFHRSALSGGVRFDALTEGDLVEFVPGTPGPKGERADRVRLQE